MTDKQVSWFTPVDLEAEREQHNRLVADQIWSDIRARRYSLRNKEPSQYEKMRDQGSFYLSSIFD